MTLYGAKYVKNRHILTVSVVYLLLICSQMNLKQTENWIRLNLKNEVPIFVKAYDCMLSYYGFEDFSKHINNCYIIDLLYKKDCSLTEITIKAGVSDSTLLRCRKEYVQCFNYYYEKLLHCNSEIAVVLNSDIPF